MLKPEVTDAGHDALVIDREMSDVGREFVANTDILDKVRQGLPSLESLMNGFGQVCLVLS